MAPFYQTHRLSLPSFLFSSLACFHDTCIMILRMMCWAPGLQILALFALQRGFTSVLVEG
jgi:hypothetical protein